MSKSPQEAVRSLAEKRAARRAAKREERGSRAKDARKAKGTRRARSADAKRAEGAKDRRARILRGLACVGVLALFLVLALLVGDSDYHATPVGWMPFVAALLCIALAQIYVRLAARSLRFHEKAQMSDCPRGSSVPFSIAFSNSGILALLDVRARLYVENAHGDTTDETTVSLTLGPRATCEIPFDVPLDHIGTFKAGLREVEVGDFIGLFRRRWQNAITSEVCVTPLVPQVGDVRFSSDSDVETPRPLKVVLADSLDYAYVRDYVPGDPLKTIHWKLSARADNYLTRLYEKNTSPGVLVIIDFFASGESADETMELVDAVVETGFAVARFAKGQGLDVEMSYVNRYGERRRLDRFDEEAALALVREMPAGSDDDKLRSCAVEQILDLSRSTQGQNNIVVCSANIGTDMIGAVLQAKMGRRAPLFLAAVPRRLVDRDLERYLTPLAALEGAGVTYHAVSRSDELEGRSL